jgi:hypothetical protein
MLHLFQTRFIPFLRCLLTITITIIINNFITYRDLCLCHGFIILFVIRGEIAIILIHLVVFVLIFILIIINIVILILYLIPVNVLILFLDMISSLFSITFLFV